MWDSLHSEIATCKYVINGDKPKEPSLIAFRNIDKALEMLNKHISRRSSITIHCDVDMDGIGSGFIMSRFLLRCGLNGKVRYLINKEKVHGIGERHVAYINNTDTDLLIVLDSSSNEVEYIKKLNCDALIVDHHEVLHNETFGSTHGGSYVIISNMVDNSSVEGINEWVINKKPNNFRKFNKYTVDNRMSCGLVLYELLRVYQDVFNTSDILNDDKLAQWVGITLFSDAVELRTERNLYYIEKTIGTEEIEPSLQAMMLSINKYQRSLDKSFINFSLVPLINKAIRAGESATALDIVLNRPQDIKSLAVYGEIQDKVLEIALRNIEEHGSFVLRNISDTGINRNYCGVIATRLCSERNKNAAVFIVSNGVAEGSFRGRLRAADYRGYFAGYDSEVYAQGHKSAFGFRVDEQALRDIMRGLQDVEENIDRRPMLTAGGVPAWIRGKEHIADPDEMTKFKQAGLLLELAIYNSRVSVDEAIPIITVGTEATFVEQVGKVYKYDILGLNCTAFEVLQSGFIEVLPEYNNREVKLYAKNLNYI